MSGAVIGLTALHYSVDRTNLLIVIMDSIGEL